MNKHFSFRIENQKLRFPETVDTRRMAKWFRLLGGLPKKEFWDYVR